MPALDPSRLCHTPPHLPIASQWAASSPPLRGGEDRDDFVGRKRLRMNLIAQTLADGLVLGGIYALAAVGISLIFGVLHVINLSHGILVLLGAYLALIFSQALRIDPLLTLPLVMAVLVAGASASQRSLTH